MRFEAELERLSPGKLPEGLISRMEAAMEGWEDVSAEVTGEIEKVVPFPKSVEEEMDRRNGASLWAAAAGVALLGAVAGLLLTGNPGEGKSGRTSAVASPSGVGKVEFAPEAAKRTILDASDQDVIIANGALPLRVMRLNYVDRVVFRNAQTGEELHVEVPAVNYRLIPVATD